MRFLDQMVRELQSLERRLATGAGATAAGAGTTAAAPSVPSRAATPPAQAAVAPAPAAGENSAAADEAPAELTRDVVRGRWSGVLEAAVSCGSRLRTALAAATVEELRGDVVVLGFTPDASFQRGAVGAAEAREPLAAAFEKALGRRLRVETVETAPAPTAADAPAADAPRGAASSGERLSAAERAAVETAPLTRLVEKELKARIVQMERQE